MLGELLKSWTKKVIKIEEIKFKNPEKKFWKKIRKIWKKYYQKKKKNPES